jgi:hypothetical protein
MGGEVKLDRDGLANGSAAMRETIKERASHYEKENGKKKI